MNLCIDIGNTRVKGILYDGDKEVFYHHSDHIDLDLLKDLSSKYPIKNCILSSTRILENEVIFFLSHHFNLLVLDETTVIPIHNGYGTPGSLGKDRLAAAVAVACLFPKQNCIIIDSGTCLTYNFINSDSIYQGGNIAPGLNMRLQAMNYFTDKLPLVEIKYHEPLFGKDTAMALQNGAVKGAIYELTSFIDEVFANYGESRIILTGGDSIIFVKHLNFKIFAHPNLVLLGLNEILKFNAGLFSNIKH